jgi:hypothetical protein
MITDFMTKPLTGQKFQQFPRSLWTSPKIPSRNIPSLVALSSHRSHQTVVQQECVENQESLYDQHKSFIKSHYFNGHFTVIRMVISLSWDTVIMSDASQAFLRDIQAFWRDIVIRTFMDIFHIVFTLIAHEKSESLFGTKRA